MTHLIDKSALVADIERRIKTNKECMLGLRNLDYYQGKVDALNDTLSFIDTLEVEENDLVEELDYNDYMTFFKEHPDYNDGSWGFEETWTFGQYCYKLGLKAQKGE